MVIDSRQKRFVMNMQFRQCFAGAKPFRLKKSQKIFKKRFSKKAKCVNKARILKSGFKKAKLATLRKGMRLECRTLRVDSLKLAKLYTRIENAHKVRKTFFYVAVIRTTTGVTERDAGGAEGGGAVKELRRSGNYEKQRSHYQLLFLFICNVDLKNNNRNYRKLF